MVTDETARLRTGIIHEWLDRVLPGRHRGLVVASSDASFRRYFRVRDRRQRYIVMDAPPELIDCRPFAAIGERLEQAGLNVPRVLAHDFERGLLLLTDLGSVHYLDVLDDDTADSLYEDAIDALVAMQARVSTRELPAYDQAFLRRELSLFDTWLLKRHLGLQLDAATEKTLARCFDILVGSCLDQPQCFVHRDYHSRNLMDTASARPGILDFQDAVAGPLAYDIASLLRDVYIEWPQSRVAGWLEHYHRAATGAGLGAGVDAKTLARMVDACGIQRHVKIAGLFCRLYYRDGKSAYLADVGQTLEHLSRVAAGYPELRPLAEIIERLDLGRRLRARNLELHARCEDAR